MISLLLLYQIWPVRVLVSLLLAAGAVWAYRWTKSKSRTLASLLAAGVILRAVLGVALYLISVFELPVFRSLQLGDGFWTLALDARSYFDVAARAVHEGPGSISSTSASPFYTRTLAVWMSIFGISPAAGLLLNVICFLITGVTLVAMAGRALTASPANVTPVAIGLAAMSFSPALLVFSTQALKDSLCIMLVVVGLGGMSLWWDAMREDRSTRVRGLVLGAGLLAVAIYGIAGIRAYAAAFMLAALVPAAAYSLVTKARIGRMNRALLHVPLAAILGLAFALGAAAYFEAYRGILLSVPSEPSAPIAALEEAREGFVGSGGATSIAAPPAATPAPAPTPAPLDPQESEPEPGLLRKFTTSLAVLVVPISLLRALSVVSFSGGAGLLALTDLDTLFVDLTLLAALYFIVRSLRRTGLSPAALCAIVLAVMLLASMAYVVTNYGILFRLRLLGLAPVWALFALLPTPAPPAGPRSHPA